MLYPSGDSAPGACRWKATSLICPEHLLSGQFPRPRLRRVHLVVAQHHRTGDRHIVTEYAYQTCCSKTMRGQGLSRHSPLEKSTWPSCTAAWIIPVANVQSLFGGRYMVCWCKIYGGTAHENVSRYIQFFLPSHNLGSSGSTSPFSLSFSLFTRILSSSLS